MVTLKWRERMQSAGDGSLVRRKRSGFEETQLCVLSPRWCEWHFPVDCLLFRELPTQHRVSLLAAAGICKKCLSHSKRDGGRAEQCEGRHVEDHWLCQSFLDPEGPGMEKRLLPVAVPQPGRQVYKCRSMIHVKTRSDLQTDDYSVQLTTLYDSTQQHSFIMNEVALAHTLGGGGVHAGAGEEFRDITSQQGEDDQALHPRCEAKIDGRGGGSTDGNCLGIG